MSGFPARAFEQAMASLRPAPRRRVRRPVAAPATAAVYEALHGIRPEDAAGLIAVATARSTGSLVGVYDSEAAGLESDARAEGMAYATVCETHGYLVMHSTLAEARLHASDPAGWCGACRGEDD